METIDPRKLLIKIAKILDKWQISYLVTGGMAVSVLGRPRFTADIDVVIEMKKKDIANLAHSLQLLDGAGYVEEDAMIDALKNEGEFNFIDGETGMKVDFWILKNDAFDKSRLNRRKEEKILDYSVYFSSPEDLILSKLLWVKASGSARQMDDVESVMKISGDKLDKKYLKIWAIKLGVSDILGDLMA
jgi:hypothetical protein